MATYTALSSHTPPRFTLLYAFAITIFLFYSVLLSSSLIYDHSINPNFTASFLGYIDNAGAFLVSQNRSFEVRITNLMIPESSFFYLAIVHSVSDTIVWSANRNHPISQSSQLRFTTNGLTLHDDPGRLVWSTPQELAPLSSLQLLESGNLVLLDAMSNIVWQSFDFPTDTLVIGQKLQVGKSLVSSTSDEDISEGSHRLVVVDKDAMLQWNGMNYWKLSNDPNAFRETNFPAEYLVMDYIGVYLMGENGNDIAIKLVLQNSSEISTDSLNFHFMKLEPNGSLTVVNSNRYDKPVWRVPVDSCRIPDVCGSLGVCVTGGKCKCSSEFQRDFDKKYKGCVPIDASIALPGPCNGVPVSGNEIKYINLSNNLDYLTDDLVNLVMYGVNLSACQNLCSSNCTCLGIFHNQNSGSCYMIKDHLGSMFNNSNSNRFGYIKTVRVVTPNANLGNKKSEFPVLAVVLPLSLGAMVIVLIGSLVRLRRRRRKLSHDSSSNANFDWIPDLPAMFNYQELETATEGFSTKIGSGGFGTVYKGVLGDTTNVAVKKIDSLGGAGKRDFLAEIATIGKIRHVNLVKLKGFCVHRSERFLIYEYMNRGSLDRTLFHGEPILEWKDRYKIALGTARGLAYLHTGCDHKIIHYDVKPENILLNDQLHVKVSDFGLSKLVNREQSGFFTTLRGTRGYIAPEWLTNTAISDKVDVYSYGMVLLEIISGMRNFSHDYSLSPSDEHGNFPLRALVLHLERQYLELVDQRMMEKAPSEQVERLVRVALCCVHREPNLRPSMCNVVRMLEGGMASWEPRIDSLNYLRFYGIGASSEEEENVFVVRRKASSGINGRHLCSYVSTEQVSGPR